MKEDKMKEDKIKELVNRHYDNGFHCAESIANTVHELFPSKAGFVCKVTSGFCGGVGRCKQDICGALSGGIIALGSIYGREDGDEDISKLVFFSVELRRLFIEEFKTTICKDVIENIKNKPGYHNCRDVTAKTAWLLYNLVQEDIK